MRHPISAVRTLRTSSVVDLRPKSASGEWPSAIKFVNWISAASEFPLPHSRYRLSNRHQNQVELQYSQRKLNCNGNSIRFIPRTTANNQQNIVFRCGPSDCFQTIIRLLTILFSLIFLSSSIIQFDKLFVFDCCFSICQHAGNQVLFRFDEDSFRMFVNCPSCVEGTALPKLWWF